MCSWLSCKIRFEAPKRQLRREIEREKMPPAKLILTISIHNMNRKVYYKSCSFCRENRLYDTKTNCCQRLR
jgi:hypothetical protein